MPEDSELTIAGAAKRLRTSTSKVRRLIHTKKLPASFRLKDGKLRYVINRRDLDRYQGSAGKRPKRQLSFEHTLATFMSIQPPIAEMRLSEISKLASERRSPLRDPDRDFDHLFWEMFGWGLDGKEDRRRLYEEWLERDGDLFYLIWLESILTGGDDLIENLRKDLRDGARVAKSTKELHDLIDSPFMDYVGGWIVAKTAQSIKDSLPSNERLEKSSDDVVHEACRQAFAYFLYNSKLAKQKRTQKDLRDILLNGVPGTATILAIRRTSMGICGCTRAQPYGKGRKPA